MVTPPFLFAFQKIQLLPNRNLRRETVISKNEFNVKRKLCINGFKCLLSVVQMMCYTVGVTLMSN